MGALHEVPNRAMHVSEFAMEPKSISKSLNKGPGAPDKRLISRF